MSSTKEQYHARMKLIREKLGGKCVVCGTTERLEIDHIDPKAKAFTVSCGWGRSWKSIEAELEKCQLLCFDHHREKTKVNGEHAGGRNKAQSIPHGTVSGYIRHKCRCLDCREAKVDYYRKR